MKICHTISSIDKDDGGTSAFLQILSNELIKSINMSVVTIKSSHPLHFNNKVKIYAANNTLSKLQGFSTQLKSNLNNIKSDLFHGNGLWHYPVHIMTRIARNRNIPYIISPHGMLEPWAINSGKWKKKLSLSLYQYNDLRGAACIHATSDIEAQNIRNLGLKNPIAIIPNGIDLLEFRFASKKQQQDKHTVLFLSRVHYKKGLELLIQAWSKLDINIRQNWQIAIAGNGESKYIASLQRLIQNKALEKEIHIIGPQFGTDKLKVYQNAELFVLPTYSENFGIVIAEALACGIPVITTKGTPWEALKTYNAGWWIDISVVSLVEALKIALQLSDQERIQMGHNGRKLVEENYSIETVSLKMILLYEWLISGGKKPDFVFI